MSTNGHRDGTGDVKRELERWNATTLKKALERGGERQAEFHTTSTTTERLYTPLDTSDIISVVRSLTGRVPRG